MPTPKQHRRAPNILPLWFTVSVCLVLASCAIQPNIPSVLDDRVEALLRSEAARILAVQTDRESVSQYQFLLSEFRRQDILGMSVGNRRIYINYKLASGALTDSRYRWLLRQTLAHEIAHEAAGHAKQAGEMWLNAGALTVGASGRDIGLPWYVRFYNYSTEKELDADLRGLGYWNKLGWDCRIWVRILEDFQKQNYTGGRFHPTDRRLQQAQSVCDLREDERSDARNAPRAEKHSSPSLN
jgi:predicted Zn-dependent protease